MDNKSVMRRTSIYLGSAIRDFLKGGPIRGRSESQRVDRLAIRYAFLIREAFPKRLQVTPAELVILAGIVENWSIEDPADTAVLGLRVAKLPEQGFTATGVDLPSFASRLRLAKPAELVALVHAAEVAIYRASYAAGGSQAPVTAEIAREVLNEMVGPQ